MLLRFSVGNHFSIREPVELSLVASALEDNEAGLINCPHTPRGKVLPSAVIYGANASGKSNVVSALHMMCSIVLNSHSRGNPSGGVPHTPFALDPVFAKAPSSFEADFIIEGVRYHYGFTASDEVFLSEWLYAFPSGRMQKLFEREEQNFTFGRGLKGRNKVIEALTRKNSLFVSAAAQNNHEELSAISNFFASIQFDNNISVPGQIAARQLADGKLDNRVIDFLGKIGTGVVGYRSIEKDMTDEAKKISRVLRAVMEKILKEGETFKLSDSEDKFNSIQLAHRSVDGENIFFDIHQESEGTTRLLMFLGPVFSALDQGTLIVIDELNASLHSKVCEMIIALFSSPETNPKGAQLIATTHDTNLLESKHLRRDQVWFTEKDIQGATQLYPLTDIRTRKGDNMEKAYLQGRYGAVPSSVSVSDFVA